MSDEIENTRSNRSETDGRRTGDPPLVHARSIRVASRGRLAFAAAVLLLIAAGPPSAAAQSEARVLEVEPVTLGPDGFEPAELTRPQGRFILAVLNRSGVQEERLRFRLDRQAGPRLLETAVRQGISGWREILDPPPGTYVISLQERPEWTFTLVVTPR